MDEAADERAESGTGGVMDGVILADTGACHVSCLGDWCGIRIGDDVDGVRSKVPYVVQHTLYNIRHGVWGTRWSVSHGSEEIVYTS